jgi:hypothetical protein
MKTQTGDSYGKRAYAGFQTSPKIDTYEGWGNQRQRNGYTAKWRPEEGGRDGHFA